MIKIENLVKIYGKGEESTKALKGINLVFGDTGLVFILGKSGCGKSTFLNMLGGLDDITEGNIIYNGASLAQISEEELNNYRNNYVGIIYQNFNLFDNDTVYNNIYIAAKESKKKTIKQDIENVLESLSLTNKKDRLVKNLSGGQKQRVAIARALVKESEVILADEPTGNLDSLNTATTFDILKEVAKTRLVIVVSHDTKSAYKYADRIISLSDGEVVDDITLNKDFVETENTIVELPQDSDIEEKEINKVNKSLSKHKLELRKNNVRFLKTGPIDDAPHPIPNLKVKKKNITSPLIISGKIFKSCISSFIVTVLLLSVIIALLAFSKNFILFDESSAISVINEKYNAQTYTLNKSYSFYDDPLNVNKDYLIEVTEEDKQIFYDGGYEGRIFELYNIPVNPSKIDSYNNLETTRYDNFYSAAGLGVAVVDIAYLNKVFGEIKVIAGSLYNLDKNDKLIVTDYFADSLLYYDIESCTGAYVSNDKDDPYQKIMNTIIKDRYTIGAIIDTGYKERYKEIIEIYEQIAEETQNAAELKQKLNDNDLLNQFAMEADNSLNIAYSINQNFKETIVSMPDTHYFAHTNNLNIYDQSNNMIDSFNCIRIYSDLDYELSKGEVLLTIPTYNRLFNQSITPETLDDFEPRIITLQLLKYNEDSKENEGLKLTVNVVGVANKTDSDMFGFFSDEDFAIMKNNLLFPYALIFENVDQCYTVNTIAKTNYFYSNLTAYSSIFTICDIIDVFQEIFIFIFIALIAIAAIILVSHNLRLVKKNRYLIGVYKSLGYPSSSFSISSLLNCIYLNITVFAISNALSFATNTLINKLLTDSFAKMLNFSLIKSMALINYSFPLICVYIGVVFGVSLLTLLAPILAIRKLKPNIILSKAVE